MLKSLLTTLGNTSVDTQMSKRDFLGYLAAGLTLGGCAKKRVTEIVQEESTKEGPIITEHISELERLADTHTFHNCGAMLALGREVHTFGGHDLDLATDNQESYTDVHEVLNPQQPDIWMPQKQRMPRPRSQMATFVLDNKIFAIGGQGPEGSYNNSVFCYDLEQGWTAIKEFAIGIFGATGVVCEGTAYVVGGRIEGEKGKAIANPVIYKYVKPEWGIEVARIPDPENFSGVAALDGKIYLFGDWWGSRSASPKSLQIYDTKSQSWDKKRMPGWLICDHAFAHKNKIIIFGMMELKAHDKTQTIFNGLFEYSPQSNGWSYIKSFKSLHSLDVCTNLDNQLYFGVNELYRYDRGIACRGSINNTKQQPIV